MLSSQSGVTDWFAKADGTSMTVNLITQSVKQEEQGQVKIDIFGPGNSVPILSRIQPMPTAGQADIEQSNEFPTTPGGVYRVRLTLIPPESGPVAHHYQLRFHGAVQIGQNSPTTPSFEPVAGPASTFWFVSVDPDETPQVRVFTPAQGTPGAPDSTQPIAATVKLRKPDGTVVQQLSLNATGGLSATLAASGRGPAGLWSVEVMNINAHYQVEKLTGTDRSIYATWVTAWCGVAPRVVLDTFPAINFVGGDAFLGRKGVEQRHSASATDPNAGDLTFEWSFGRKTTYLNTFRATDQASVTFATPGVHRVRVRVTDGEGGSASASLRKVVVDSFACTRGSRFWNQQFGAGGGKSGGAKKIDDATLQAYLDILHITSRLFSDVTLEEARAVLGTQLSSSMRAKAEAEALAAWLNFARGAIALDERFFVDNQGSTKRRMIFAEAMIEVEATLSNPDATKNELERAKDIAEAANQSDSNDPACMADPDLVVFTPPTIQLSIFYFSCGAVDETYLRARNGSGATWVVDDDGAGLSVDYSEIVDAVAATVDGDLIYVCPGTYTGDFSIPTAISVISLAGADDTIIRGNSVDTVPYNVELRADVLLQGFKIKDGGSTVCSFDGGGVFVTNRSSPVIRQNKIMHNENCGGAGMTLGVATNATVENNIIAYNTATSNGAGGIHDLGAAGAKIINNVIAYNVAGPDSTINPAGGGIGVSSGTVYIRNNILYCNTSYPGYNVISLGFSGSMTIEYNNSFGNTDTAGASQDYTGGTGNINSDPLFARTFAPIGGGTCGAVLSYQLQSSSPSIDAGDLDPAYDDVDETRNDQGTYGGPNGDW